MEATRRRPVQFRSQERCRRIVEAAEELIGEGGLPALSLSEVAARSGCAIGSVYQYFSGREDLIDAVSERVAQRFAMIRADVLQASEAASTGAFVSAVLEPVVAFWDECPAALHLLDRVRQAAPSPQRELQRSLTRFVTPIVATVTVELIKAALRTLAGAPRRRRGALRREFEQAITAYLCAKERATT